MISCRQCQTQFSVTVSDAAFYQGWNVSNPTLCPSCRLRRRMSFRNERSLYQRKCDATGKPIISIHRPDQPYPVYSQDYWWSDAWDAMMYGRDYDFTQPFSTQLKALYNTVPHIALFTTNVSNSEYTNYGLNLKDCYLLFGATNDEKCLHGKFVISSQDTVDALSVFSCELCYEAVASERCNACRWITNSKDCSDCWFVGECQSCTSCMMCFGLHSKEYYILNEYVGKDKFEEFKTRYASLTTTNIADLQQQFNALKSNLPHRASHIYSSENCSGDFVINSVNCQDCYDIKEGENCHYVSNSPHPKDSMDGIFTSPVPVEHCYEFCSSTGVRDVIGSFMVWNSSNVGYSLECHQSHDLFGCVGLRNKQYCIFNKQYDKDTYLVLRQRIIEAMQQHGEWGEFLAPSISPFGYNETIAQEYYPLSKDQALQLGYQWYDEPVKQYQPQTYLVPANIELVTDDILQQTLTCTQCSKNFKIVTSELAFYRSRHLPIPELCPGCRHLRRVAAKGPYQLFERQCAKCGNTIMTNKTETAAVIVYCDTCYKAEFY